jgi:hypothetical protein
VKTRSPNPLYQPPLRTSTLEKGLWGTSPRGLETPSVYLDPPIVALVHQGKARLIRKPPHAFCDPIGLYLGTVVWSTIVWPWRCTFRGQALALLRPLYERESWTSRLHGVPTRHTLKLTLTERRM